MKPTRFLAILLMTVICPSFSLRAQEGWVNLFNGQNLDGWEEHSGHANYFVQDGLLIGQSVAGSGNSFLCTTQKFANFELELDYQCDALLNSGVQFRSECFPDARTLNIDGKTIRLAPDRIHGYQCEIDMNTTLNRMWTAGIYDEARRGWLLPAAGDKSAGQAFIMQGRAVSKPGEWNHLRILAVGPSIQTWLNGVPRADLYDGLTTNGVLGLQVHGVGTDTNRTGLKVRFRNIRLREITPQPNVLSEQEQADGWRLLWDGKTTDGWRSPKSDAFPTTSWVITNDEFRVVSSGFAEAKIGGDIITRERFSNFELRADFITTPGCNSGIKIFVQPNIAPITPVGQRAAVGSAIGMEFQILDDQLNKDAKLGHNGDRTCGSLYDLIPAPTNKVVMPMGEWNHARILSRGKHVEFWLNGRKTVEFERGSATFRELVAISKYRNIPDFGEWADGHILLQEHGSEVSFQNVKLRVLPPE